LKAERNEGSKQVNQTRDSSERSKLIGEMRELGERIATSDGAIAELDAALNDLLLRVPNLPAPEVPVGLGESENVVVSEHNAPRQFPFMPQPHWEIGERLGIIDFERGTKISGSRFYLLRGDGARLQRALITWMLDIHTQNHGFTEIYPPYLVLEDMLIGTGNLPKFAETLFRDIEGEKWLIPTAEVPLTNMYRDEILDESELPINHVAYSACFRREQISAGRDVRGIKRGYQFDKVEMVKFVHPNRSAEELQTLLLAARAILDALELPYRVLLICTGDLSFTAANKIDLEVWGAGTNEWLEVSSCSSFLEFQARRANIRFRPNGGGRLQFVHTLNGSGLALPRTMIAVIEQYQREDGSIAIPSVLQSYMCGQTVIGVQPGQSSGSHSSR
nr:serine--tRNA ligase [Chloroflexota bacterium]